MTMTVTMRWKRLFSLLLLLGVVVCPQLFSREKPLVVVLKGKSIPPYAGALEGFREHLSQQGVIFDSKVFDVAEDALPPELERLQADLVVTLGSSVTKAAVVRLKNTPIVCAMVLEPEKIMVNARNVAGVSLDIPVKLQFQSLTELMPQVKTIGVIYHPLENQDNIDEAVKAAAAMGLTLKPTAVEKTGDIPRLDRLNIDALWIITDTTVCRPPIIKRLLLDGLKYKIPIMGISPMYARAGALLALSCNYIDIGRQAGEIAEKLLNGTAAADIGIVQPREVKLYINQAVAQRLGVTIPEHLRERAEEVYGR